MTPVKREPRTSIQNNVQVKLVECFAFSLFPSTPTSLAEEESIFYGWMIVDRYACILAFMLEL